MKLRTIGVLVTVAAMLLVPVTSGEAARCRVLPPKVGIYHAAFPSFISDYKNEDYVRRRLITRYEELAQKPIVWAYFSNHWFKGIRFPRKNVQRIRRQGKIPFIRMMPWTRAKQDVRPGKYKLQNIIDGRFDRQLKRWARQARRVRGPLMVEFGTEVNGQWFPWSGRWNGGARKSGFGNHKKADGPERFRAAYRHIIRLFRKQRVRNITWVFHVDTSGSPERRWNRIENYYPGDRFIDWIGLSAYGVQDSEEKWTSFARKLREQRAYRRVTRMSKRPIAILEYGTAERRPGYKARWIRNALNELATGRYPRVKAVSYWHEKWEEDGGEIVNIRIDSSTSALRAYRQGIANPAFVSRVRLSRGCRK